MRKVFFGWQLTSTLIFVFGISFTAFSQQSSFYGYKGIKKVNYLRTWIPKRPLTDSTQVVTNINPAEVEQTTKYFDGLSRLLQTVVRKATPQQKDFVSMVEYDALGREALQYLPFGSRQITANDFTDDGSFKFNPIQQQDSCYKIIQAGQGQTYFYSQTLFEPSPLNRPVKSLPAGNSWVGSNRGVGQLYEFNQANEVRRWDCSVTGTSVPTSSGFYNAGVLYRTITVDEHGKKVVEYKDKSGQVLLKKVEIKHDGAATIPSHAGWLCTYYVYNDLGQLRWVIQPAGVQTLESLSWIFDNNDLTSSVLAKEQCFFYDYDTQGRMVDKSVPAAGLVEIVYDKRDRIAMSRTAKLAQQGFWLAMKYDELNRNLKVGLIASSRSQAANQVSCDSSMNYPVVTDASLMQENYFDNYAWVNGQGGTATSFSTGNVYGANFITTYNVSPYYAQPMTPDTVNLLGIQTGAKVRILGTAGTFLFTQHFFDEKKRIIQTTGNNISGGKDVTTNQYDFSGKLIRTHIRHDKYSPFPSRLVRISTRLEYDHMGRLSQVKKALSAGAERIVAAHTYDEIGQLKTKTIGGTLETQTFDYNVRGWLLGMNRSYLANSTVNFFGYDMGYDRPETILPVTNWGQPQYNGNISGTMFRGKSDGEVRSFDYRYDPANRLLSADYNQLTNGSMNKQAGFDFSIRMGNGIDPTTAYDANGNIKQMVHKGWKANGTVTIDSLMYAMEINSNKLRWVRDLSNDVNTKLGDFKEPAQNNLDNQNINLADYTYDADGNMTADKNKSITSIQYTHLNTPFEVVITGKGKISYTYDNLGNKLKKTVIDNTVVPADTTTWLYIQNFVYKDDTLQFFTHDEGRARADFAQTAPEATAFFFDYFLKDHLGNVRSVITEEAKTDAYPALSFEGTAGSQQVNDQNAFWENRTGSSINVTSVRVGRAGGNELLVRKSTGAIGAAKLLKVMAGDKIHTSVDYYYSQVNSNNTGANGLASLVTNFATALSASGQVTALLKDGASTINTALQNTPALGTLLNTPNNTSGGNNAPKAYLNIVFFDEQFKYDGTSSVVVPVAYNVNTKATISRMAGNAVLAKKSGYVYVYVSNESDEMVYFDNFLLSHERGPLLEETHYYPFGLTMAGISSKALGTQENKNRFNKNSELQNKEFSDGSGLEWYATTFRMYDPQIGRWHVIDPKPTLWESAYAGMKNNPITYNDPLGDTVKQQGFTNQQILDWLATGLKTSGKANPFSFKGGRLRYSQSKIDKLSKEQQEIANGIVGAIKSDVTFTLTKVSENDKVTNDPKLHTIGDNGEKIYQPTFKDMKWTGMTTEIDDKNVQINIVLPNSGVNADPGKVNTEGKMLSATPSWLTVFHEVGGHGNLRYVLKDPDQRGRTIDYENKLRSLHGMELRGYDGQHPKPKEKEE
jgi:RHS repeat-associated protein